MILELMISAGAFMFSISMLKNNNINKTKWRKMLLKSVAILAPLDILITIIGGIIK